MLPRLFELIQPDEQASAATAGLKWLLIACCTQLPPVVDTKASTRPPLVRPWCAGATRVRGLCNTAASSQRTRPGLCQRFRHGMVSRMIVL